MKLISLFLLLFLIISIKAKSFLDAYSIDQFIKDLKENGVLEIIESIKNFYGQDVAIISCEELNKNRKGNCKRLVTEYMKPKYEVQIPKKRGIILKSQSKYEKCIKNLKFAQFMKLSYRRIFSIKKELSRKLKYNKEEANFIFNNIKKKAKKDLPPCLIFNF